MDAPIAMLIHSIYVLVDPQVRRMSVYCNVPMALWHQMRCVMMGIMWLVMGVSNAKLRLGMFVQGSHPSVLRMFVEMA